jgi:hypothetical protein
MARRRGFIRASRRRTNQPDAGDLTAHSYANNLLTEA